MFYTYILKSLKTNKFYVGSTQDLEQRFLRHSNGYTKSLNNKGPFKLVYQEAFNTRAEAYKREKQIKSYKGGQAFKKLIS